MDISHRIELIPVPALGRMQRIFTGKQTLIIPLTVGTYDEQRHLPRINPPKMDIPIRRYCT